MIVVTLLLFIAGCAGIVAGTSLENRRVKQIIRQGYSRRAGYRGEGI